MQRIVTPERLDSLPHDDPSAVRSRRDLRLINAMMGNTRWIRRALRRTSLPPRSRIIELGAGDGTLARQLAGDGWHVIALDLAPRPRDLPDTITWIEGDAFEELPALSGDALVANLFWHHFDNTRLTGLAPAFKRFRVVVTSEPLRAPFANWLGSTLVPIVNDVTRHDMFASIRAGFRSGELPARWQLSPPDWRVRETTGMLGAYRLVAHRKS